VEETGLESCLIMDFGINDVEPFGSATRVLII